jgi:hypothetical protein
MVLWGIERYLDEHLWLGEDGHLGSLLVQWAGGILAVAGIILLVARFGDLQRWRRGEGGDPAPVPEEAVDTDVGQDTADAADTGDAAAGAEPSSTTPAGSAPQGSDAHLPASVPSAPVGPEPD